MLKEDDVPALKLFFCLFLFASRILITPSVFYLNDNHTVSLFSQNLCYQNNWLRQRGYVFTGITLCVYLLTETKKSYGHILDAILRKHWTCQRYSSLVFGGGPAHYLDSEIL